MNTAKGAAELSASGPGSVSRQTAGAAEYFVPCGIAGVQLAWVVDSSQVKSAITH
ncbi:hypothetical protein AB8989_03765 [Yersinia hibernica]|uniref:hypothetical protein n=1 Tax=Yersinia hibernica TaxID=2339259 RepID=UPI00138FB9C6|nr:hypothetical protein [Yersinia hibernica]